MNNLEAEKQKAVVEIMALAFRRTLAELIGSPSHKPSLELIAWSKAFIELDIEFRQALLKNDVLN